MRKEMYELARPNLSRFFGKEADSADQDADDSQTDSEPEMTDSARTLAEEFDLTAEQIAEIKPTGTTGKILKDDVEDYIETLGTD